MIEWAWFIAMLQPSVATQSPENPVKTDPGSGVALMVTRLPIGKFAWQLFPQLIPAGFELTVPDPGPCLETARVGVVEAKVAVTVCAWLRGSVQVFGLELLQPA